MNTRLCERLNEGFLPRKPKQTIYTHESTKTWNLVENSLLSMAKASSEPQQLWIHIRFEKTTSIVTLSNGKEEKWDVTSQGIKDILARAESEGLKVKCNSSNNEFTFTFTPSNI